MSFFYLLSEIRKRRRKLSRFDSPFRQFTRRVERAARFSLINPLGIALHPKRARTPIQLSEVSSIFILRYDAIGDAILTTPVWRWLKIHAPHIRIGVASSARNHALLAADPDIDEVYTFSKAISFSVLRELLRARKLKWDVVINPFFHDKTRGAIFSKIIAPKGLSATSVRERKELYERLYSVLVNRPPLHPPTPMVQQILCLVKEVIELPLDFENAIPSLPTWEMISNTYTPYIQSLLQSFGKKDYIIINTDASQLYKEWGLENSLKLGEQIAIEMPNCHVFLSSAPERAETVRKELLGRKEMSYLETPSIVHLSIAVRGSLAVVSPDTSVIHFATAQQVPVVGLYLEENEFLPYGSPSRVLFAPDGKITREIPVDKVLLALNELMKEKQDRSSILLHKER